MQFNSHIKCNSQYAPDTILNQLDVAFLLHEHEQVIALLKTTYGLQLIIYEYVSFIYVEISLSMSQTMPSSMLHRITHRSLRSARHV